MTTVATIRARIASLEQDIASHIDADKYRDGRRQGSDDTIGNMRHRVSRLRLELLEVATWVDLVDDAERDAYLLRFFDDKARGANAAAGRDYLFRRLQLAREAEDLQARCKELHAQHLSLRTRVGGLRAEIDLLGRAGARVADFAVLLLGRTCDVPAGLRESLDESVGAFRKEHASAIELCKIK